MIESHQMRPSPQPSESNNSINNTNEELTSTTLSLPLSSAKQRNVTFAINYQVSLVDEFVGAPPRRSRTLSHQESSGEGGLFFGAIQQQQNKQQQASGQEQQLQQQQQKQQQQQLVVGVDDDGEEKTRRSNRDRQGKREISLARIRVRYDMQTVPMVRRNEEFLTLFDKWWASSASSSSWRRQRRLQQAQQLEQQQEDENENENLNKNSGTTTNGHPQHQQQQGRKQQQQNESYVQPSSFKPQVQQQHQQQTVEPRRSSRLLSYPASNVTTTTEGPTTCEHCNPQASPPPRPFLDDSSVVWVPPKRSEWEDCISEMTAVCATAARRRGSNTRRRTRSNLEYNSSKNNNKNNDKNTLPTTSGGGRRGDKNHIPNHLNNNINNNKPNPTIDPAPLSRDYISDRVDIDDPLNGYQIRHANGGWLQGFIMWTNFTTWTHYFRWDSLHPQSGIASDVLGEGPASVDGGGRGGKNNNPNETSIEDDHHLVDRDGSLSKALESLPRKGDPLVSGVIFENVAEIGLVGALGCGEHLLRMALDDIKSRKHYKFVVLQATESSRRFYEKFGFVRVGAICRYHSKTTTTTNNTNNNSNNKNNNTNKNSSTNGRRSTTNTNKKKRKRKKAPRQQQEQKPEMDQQERYENPEQQPEQLQSLSPPPQQQLSEEQLVPVQEQQEPQELVEEEKPQHSFDQQTQQPYPSRPWSVGKEKNEVQNNHAAASAAVDETNEKRPKDVATFSTVSVAGTRNKTDDEDDDEENPPIVGYRHWTHANESDASLQMHGGPSCMMCLPLPPADDDDDDESESVGVGGETTNSSDEAAECCSSCSKPLEQSGGMGSFLDAMMSVAVPSKPIIEPLTNNNNMNRSGILSSSKALQQQSALWSSSSSSSVMKIHSANASPATKKRSVRKPLDSSSDTALPEPNVSSSSISTKALLESTTSLKPAITTPSSPRPPSSKRMRHSVSKLSGGSCAAGTEPPSKRRKTEDCASSTTTATPRFANAIDSTIDSSPATPTVSMVQVQEQELGQQQEEEDRTSSRISEPVAETLALPDSKVCKGHNAKNGVRRNLKNSGGSSNAMTANTTYSATGDRTYYSVRGSDGRFTRSPTSDSTTQRETHTTTTTTSNKSPTRKSKRAEAAAATAKLRQLPQRRSIDAAASSKSTAVASAPANSHTIRKGQPTERKLKKQPSTPSGSSSSSSSIKNSGGGGGRKFKKINRAEIRKQKVKAYPRNRPHFYNRVVKPIKKMTGSFANGVIGGRQYSYFFVLHYNEVEEQLRLVPMEARGIMMGKRQGRPRYICCIGTTDENFVTQPVHNYQVVPATMVMKTPWVAQEAWDIEDDDEEEDD